MDKKLPTADIYVQGNYAAKLTHEEQQYILIYDEKYSGPPISLTLPIRSSPYVFTRFPPFFDGLLPEGPQLEALLKQGKIDRHDYFSQLIRVGHDLVGAVTVLEHKPHD